MPLLDRSHVPETSLRFNAQGLIPAILQDEMTGEVLMVAWMNADALSLTLSTGEAHFWSRSRREIWHKGGTSGHVQRVTGIWVDCDADTLLLSVAPAGPACHTGSATCFFRRLTPDGPRDDSKQIGPVREDQMDGTLELLEETLRERLREKPSGSYTVKLAAAGIQEVSKKVGEEAIEVIIAAQSQGPDRITAEAADLIYHLTLLLVQSGVSWHDVRAELRRRSRP